MEFVGNTQLVAGTPDAVGKVLRLIDEAGHATAGNPDVYVRTYTQFGIDDALDLRERAGSRALNGRRIFVLSVPGMTNEAQNALLKTLEEPRGDALFFFILPAPENLLPTLLSRSQMLDVGAAPVESVVDVRAFLKSSPAKRLEMLKPLFERDEDDRRDISGAVTFLSSLERILEIRVQESGIAGGLEAIYMARRYMTDKGALLKPLLEQVALLIPVVQ